MALRDNVIKKMRIIRDLLLLSLVIISVLTFTNVNFTVLIPPEKFNLNFSYFVLYLIISPILSTIIIIFTVILFRNKKSEVHNVE